MDIKLGKPQCPDRTLRHFSEQPEMQSMCNGDRVGCTAAVPAVDELQFDVPSSNSLVLFDASVKTSM
jgi:hypothetical protein